MIQTYLPVCNEYKLGHNILRGSRGYTPVGTGMSSPSLRHTRPAHGTWEGDTWRDVEAMMTMFKTALLFSYVSV